MPERYILICSQRNLLLPQFKAEVSVLEHGAEARLKTYLEGIIKGLQIAGFKVYMGFRKSKIAKKEDISYQFELLTEQEWKDY